MQSITGKINKAEAILKLLNMSSFFELVECMDAICVIRLLYYKPIIRTLCSKSSFFCGNEPSLYPYHIIGIFIKVTFFRDGSSQ